jgi:lysophospholipase L1-like esterase
VRRALAVVLTGAMAGAAAAPAHACGAGTRLQAARTGGDGRAPLAIGDSVMLGAARPLARTGVEVDARGCRQWGQGVQVIRARRRAGTLPRVVIVALGTNGAVTRGGIRDALRAVGRRRLLVLVTPRELGGGSGGDAGAVRWAGRRFGDRVLVIDWVRRSRGRGGWFAGDGIHLSGSGARGMVRVLRPALRAEPPQVAPC